MNGDLKYKHGTQFGVGDVVVVECDDQYAMSVDSQLIKELRLICSQDRQWVTIDGWKVEPDCKCKLNDVFYNTFINICLK